MEFVRSIARKVTVLHEGRVLAEGPMDEVQADPRVIEVYLGSDAMLATEKLNQFYGESHILWDVDLESRAGGCTCLMGRNGVGKTTLLKVIMGLLPASSGKIRFQDTQLRRQAARGARARRASATCRRGARSSRS